MIAIGWAGVFGAWLLVVVAVALLLLPEDPCNSELPAILTAALWPLTVPVYLATLVAWRWWCKPRGWTRKYA